MTTRTSSRRPRGIAAVTVGLGIAYLVLLAAFALASSPRPPALGWLGFAVVVGVVVVSTLGVGDFLARSDRDPRL